MMRCETDNTLLGEEGEGDGEEGEGEGELG